MSNFEFNDILILLIVVFVTYYIWQTNRYGRIIVLK